VSYPITPATKTLSTNYYIAPPGGNQALSHHTYTNIGKVVYGKGFGGLQNKGLLYVFMFLIRNKGLQNKGLLYVFMFLIRNYGLKKYFYGQPAQLFLYWAIQSP
jgi:hypothetical protein